MRAKFVNEAIGFERYKNPRIALGLKSEEMNILSVAIEIFGDRNISGHFHWLYLRGDKEKEEFLKACENKEISGKKYLQFNNTYEFDYIQLFNDIIDNGQGHYFYDGDYLFRNNKEFIRIKQPMSLKELMHEIFKKIQQNAS